MNLIHFGRAMKQLGIEMIPAYSPEARGPSRRAFRTHQDRLPRELATSRHHYVGSGQPVLEAVYRPAFNAEFRHLSLEFEFRLHDSDLLYPHSISTGPNSGSSPSQEVLGTPQVVGSLK
jgi:hypothetical protein